MCVANNQFFMGQGLNVTSNGDRKTGQLKLTVPIYNSEELELSSLSLLPYSFEPRH